MKHSYLIPIAIAMLTAVGCDDNENYGDVCGDGHLGEHEICDGALKKPGLTAYCPNGTPANILRAVCTPECTLDLSDACRPASGAVCGNGIIEEGESCDNSIPTITANCPNPDMSKAKCVRCQIVDEGICPNTADVDKCGNGTIDPGELCDGINVPAEVRKCPANMSLNINPLFKCTENCQIVDVSRACHFTPELLCGNETLDTGENCDGDLFDEEALKKIDCGPGKKFDPSKVLCSDCNIDTTRACTDLPYEGLILSEINPSLTADAHLNGIAVEIANRGRSAIEPGDYGLSLFSASKIEKTYPFRDLNIKSAIEGKKTRVICFQNTDEALFGDKCDAVIRDNVLLDNIGQFTMLGITHGPDHAFTDLLNFMSFIAGVDKGATNFLRGCSARPHTTPADTTMGTPHWFITAQAQDAPIFGLGSHCENDAVMPDDIECRFKLLGHELTDRNQTVDMVLEIKIPGITDKTDKTDVNKSMIMNFSSGTLEDGFVDELNLHFATPVPDENWTSQDGFDRYVGTLHNWGTFEGFMAGEAGQYVYDARLSFDHEETFVYCGSSGIVENYNTYEPSKRELLTVTYDDAENARCGDGIISSSEVCDGSRFVENAMICPDPGQVLLHPEYIGCSGCSMTNIENACGKPIDGCGNGKINSQEICDGDNIPEKARVCPKGTIPKADPIWKCSDTCSYVDTSEACEKACGNGKIDTDVPNIAPEVCDGGNIPEAAKVCPKGMVPKADAVWKCSDTCGGIIVEDACEKACGNGKIDTQAGEQCEGDSFIDNIAGVCGSSSTYHPERKTCNSKCRLDTAACVLNDTNLVIDEYFIAADDNGTPRGMAISINNYGDRPLDATACTVWIFDKDGHRLSNGSNTAFSIYQMDSIAKDRLDSDKKLILNPCDPLVLCSIPMDDEATHNHFAKDLLKDKCNAAVSLPDGDKLNGDYFITRRDEIATIQITCGGSLIDVLDVTGMNAAVDAGRRQGALTTKDPWPSAQTSVFEHRFTSTDTTDIDKFAAPTCNDLIQ